MEEMKLPPPPVLKTTIIQLNKDLDQDNGNFEILTNDYNEPNEEKIDKEVKEPVKKRRRSNSNINKEELAKRKFETKQLHSIIEKRRRIKINREFEALKYLIPACRAEGTTSTINSPNLTAKKTNNSKIDGMYKLTILKSSVEYILYLHHIISKQTEMIKQANPQFDFDPEFTNIPLNVNEYRNIDKEFDFKQLVNDFDDKGLRLNNSSTSLSGSLPDFNFMNLDEKEKASLSDEEFQLPSPIITPDMQPNKYQYNSKFQLPDPVMNLPKKKLFKNLPKELIINENEEESATKTLLSLRKSLIDNLLN